MPSNIVWLFENHISLLCWRLTRGNALLASGGPSAGKYFKRTQGVCIGYLPNTKVCFCDQLHIFGFDQYLMKVVFRYFCCQLTSPWSSLGWLAPGTLTWIASVNFIGALFRYFANSVKDVQSSWCYVISWSVCFLLVNTCKLIYFNTQAQVKSINLVVLAQRHRLSNQKGKTQSSGIL